MLPSAEVRGRGQPHAPVAFPTSLLRVPCRCLLKGFPEVRAARGQRTFGAEILAFEPGVVRRVTVRTVHLEGDKVVIFRAVYALVVDRAGILPDDLFVRRYFE